MFIECAICKSKIGVNSLYNQLDIKKLLSFGWLYGGTYWICPHCNKKLNLREFTDKLKSFLDRLDKIAGPNGWSRNGECKCMACEASRVVVEYRKLLKEKQNET